MKCRRSRSSHGARLRGASAHTEQQAVDTRAANPQAALQSASARDRTKSSPLLRIDGHSEESVHHADTVIVGPNGSVIGDVYARAIVVEGEVNGNVHAAESLRIAASAAIVGHIYAPRLSVAPGAKLRGNITMRPRLTPPTDLDDVTVDTLLSGGRQA